MKKLAMAMLLGASTMLAACTHNLAVKTDSDRVYLNTNLKAVTLSAMQAINASNLAVVSTQTPVAGMVVIAARGTENALLHIEAPKLTLTLSEVEPSRIRVEATAILPGQTADFGLTSTMIDGVLKSIDAKHDVAGQPPRAQ